MKLVTFAAVRPDRPLVRAGALEGDRVVDIDAAIRAMGATPVADGRDGNSDLLTLLRGEERALELTRAAVAKAIGAGEERNGDETLVRDMDEVELLAPLPRPNSLRDYLVVREHVEGALKKLPEEWFNIPAHWKANVDEVYGPDDTVPWPAYTDKLDYELEICAVIGSAGYQVSESDASRHIVGYTLYNDWSARDIQMREMSIGIGPGISKDFAMSLGPCIATPDEFDRDTARLTARIDGEVWSAGVLGEMYFTFEQIIEWTSQEMTLRPGDLLGSGTIAKGCGLELDRWVEEGATVELEAEGIGVLRNVVGFKGQGPDRVVKGLEGSWV
jgi:2-keto-4-pentenoate hydratase/2-oxohepta-3-ene-1,7-dioic acid hydratase in catechol pathway